MNQLNQAKQDCTVSTALINEVYQHLKTKQELDNQTLLKLGKQNSTASWFELYEAMEIASILNTISLLRQNPSRRELIKFLTEQEELLPNPDVRESKQLQLQQFSTPLPYAFCAYLLAGVTDKDIFLEPSAGNGALALFPVFRAKETYLNEIDFQRLANLDYIYRDEPISQHNAENIDDFLDSKIKPNVIILNPPFTSSLAQGKTNKTVEFHLYSAAKRLAKGGRLVLISQDSFHPQASSREKFFERLNPLLKLEVSFRVPGDLYKKRGTTFPTRLSLFRKTTYSIQPEEYRPATIEELYKQVLAHLRKAKQQQVLHLPQAEIKQESLFSLDSVFIEAQPSEITTEPKAADTNQATKITSASASKITWNNPLRINYNYKI